MSCRPGRPNWRLGKLEDLIELETYPCANCFGPILEFLALDPESPVGIIDGDAVELPADPYGAADGHEGPQVVSDGAGAVFRPPPRARPPLQALTEEVLVAGAGSKVFHVPTAEGPLCGLPGTYRPKERLILRGTRDPCKECYDLDVIEWDPGAEWP